MAVSATSRWLLFTGNCCVLVLAAACSHKPSPASVQTIQRDRPEVTAPRQLPNSSNPIRSPITFEVQQLPFEYQRGDTGACWPVEPVGGGVGLIDFDNDGDWDLFFPQGGPLLSDPETSPTHDVLLRNDAGVFVDVSEQVGLQPRGYGQGVAVADYDADGLCDVYITRYGRNTLWRNRGGHFEDVTSAMGVECPLWSLGATFADFDGDEDLDLFVCNYLHFDPSEAPFARDPETGQPQYSQPADFPGLPDRLYRNDGDCFVDVSAEAGIDVDAWSMAVLAADFDLDGRQDFLVAVDAASNLLWRNLGDGRFKDVALLTGIAVNAQGQPEANMGIAFGDVDGNQLADVLITHFWKEHDTLWQAFRDDNGGIYYADSTAKAGLALISRDSTGWGTALADFDHDRDLDLVVVNGHLRRWPDAAYPYENPCRVFANDGAGSFTDVSASAGEYFSQLWQARGLAICDLDGDGAQDLVVVHQHRPAVVLWNRTPNRGGFLQVRLVGARGNKTAIGARVELQSKTGCQIRSIDGGGSYLSASSPHLHLGLGQDESADQLTIHWPNGQTQTLRDLPANQTITIHQ